MVWYGTITTLSYGSYMFGVWCRHALLYRERSSCQQVNVPSRISTKNGPLLMSRKTMEVWYHRKKVVGLCESLKQNYNNFHNDKWNKAGSIFTSTFWRSRPYDCQCSRQASTAEPFPTSQSGTRAGPDRGMHPSSPSRFQRARIPGQAGDQ